MMLAVTSPHGVAAWIGWGFAILAPLASVFVAFVALRVSSAADRRETSTDRARAFADARLVKVEVDHERNNRMTGGSRTGSYWLFPCTITNDGTSAIYGVEVSAWIAPGWIARVPRAIVSEGASSPLGDIANDDTRPFRLLPRENRRAQFGATITITEEEYDSGDSKMFAPHMHDGPNTDIGPRVEWLDRDGQRWVALPFREPERIGAIEYSKGRWRGWVRWNAGNG